MEEDDHDWVEDDELSALGKTKVSILKVLRHRCLIHAETETALDVVTPVIKMLAAFLENDGTIIEGANEE